MQKSHNSTTQSSSNDHDSRCIYQQPPCPPIFAALPPLPTPPHVPAVASCNCLGVDVSPTPPSARSNGFDPTLQYIYLSSRLIPLHLRTHHHHHHHHLPHHARPVHTLDDHQIIIKANSNRHSHSHQHNVDGGRISHTQHAPKQYFQMNKILLIVSK